MVGCKDRLIQVHQDLDQAKHNIRFKQRAQARPLPAKMDSARERAPQLA